MAGYQPHCCIYSPTFYSVPHKMFTIDVSTDSSAGFASFSGFAVLGNPVHLPNSSVVDLTAQIFLGSKSASSLYGLLRYFNGGEDRIVFSQGPPMLFFIEATVTSTVYSSLAHILTSFQFAQVPSIGSNLPYETTDCDFVGDILRVSL